jgi:hypothetical protein
VCRRLVKGRIKNNPYAVLHVTVPVAVHVIHSTRSITAAAGIRRRIRAKDPGAGNGVDGNDSHPMK